MDEGWATANPAQRVRLTKAPPPVDEHVVLTPEQIDRVAEELTACPPYDLLVRFAAWTGLRAGELTALRIRDVNPLSGEVAAVRTMYRDPQAKSGWRVDTPKTRANRSVAIYDDGVVADLRRYLAAHPHAANPDALLWPGRRPGSTRLDYDSPFDHRVFMRRTFAPAARRADLPDGLTWHTVRHASASILLAAGMPVWVVSRNLGHASTATTEAIYAHAFDNRDHSAERAQVAAFRARRSSADATVSVLGG